VPSSSTFRSEKHDALFHALSIPTQKPEVREAWRAFMEEVGQERAALRHAYGVIQDFSDGRLDPLVALGKIGLRITEVFGD
jgi:hypothetical protein